MTEQFVGTWKLLAYENRGDNGRVTYPLGEDAQGYIVYTAEGCVSVNISAVDRPSLSGAGYRTGTTGELAETARSYLAYAGTYEIGDGEVLHHVQIALFPSLLGVQRRRYHFEGDRLTLSTEPVKVIGGHRQSALTWERVRV